MDSLSSCCRLRNELAELLTFSYSLGAGGVVTGSSQVITLNLNRLVQNYKNVYGFGYDDTLIAIADDIRCVHKFLLAHKEIYKEYIDAGLLPAYSAGYMSLDKQFLTIGINGLTEAMEFLGFKVGNNKEYKDAVRALLQIFTDENKKALKSMVCGLTRSSFLLRT